MESALAAQAKEALIDAARLMTPAERLQAFANHSELMMELYLAGQRERLVSKKEPL